MKKNLLFLLLLSLIVSCKKSQTVKPVTPVQNGPKLLLASETDFYNSIPLDTADIYYAYNNNNQMISEVTRNPAGLTIDSILFSYDGNGNLTEIHSVSRISFENYDYFISYQNNEPVSLTSQTLNSMFAFSNNMLIISNPSYPDLGGDTIIYQGNNIKSLDGTNYTYGTHHGPLSAANFKINLGGIMPFFSTNEVIKTDNEGTNPPITNYSYSYNSSGYPTTLTEAYGNGDIVEKVNYNYVAAH
jgi:hypothetical protein